MPRLLDTLLVFAVGTILIIRTELWLTNYPELGGHGLHIAHLLWGGLGMLIAIVILVSFLNPVARQVGAVLGGVGLGFFIDELGKFLTSDNNYFFKPTAAIIYVFFILFFLGARQLPQRGLSSREYLVNALELAKDAAGGTMDTRERDRAFALLARADQSDPMAGQIRALLERAPVVPAEQEPLLKRAGIRLRGWYRGLTERRWFVRLITVIFALWGLSTLLEIVGLIMAYEPHLAGQEAVKIRGSVTSKAGHFGFVEWANLAASITSGLLVLWGLALLRRSRARAYAMFERALLVSIFLTQVFVFIESQFGAVLGFLVDVLLFFTVRYMLDRERELEETAARTLLAATPGAAPAVPA